MELLEKFKQHLLSQKNASKITVKNYLADIRKFVRWFETKYQRSFDAQAITPLIAEEYKKQISASTADQGSASPSSVKRYLSSLKKFFVYLTDQGIVASNPFAITVEQQQEEIDPWRIKDFKNYLYTDKASKLTIKNYMIDVQQFLNWLYETTQAATIGNNRGSILGEITTEVIEEYKNRLLHEAKLSPVSVNRKLSSLRKYVAWITNQGFVKNELEIHSATSPAEASSEAHKVEPVPEVQPVPVVTLESFAQMQETKEEPIEEVKKQYSRIPFIRFGQKIGTFLNFLFEMLVIFPFSKAIATTRYSLWKAAGREVFKPLPEVVKAYGETIPAQVEAVVPIKTASNVALASARILALINKLLVVKGKTKFGKIKNFPKSLYAPLSISTKHLPWTQKLLHHLRYTRPAWYRQYHSYVFAHYLHVGILLIFVTVTGVGMYQALFDGPRSQKPALAALPTSPPRILSFQGRLTDSSNTPLTAATPLRFGIYSSQTASGSALLWQETQKITPDENGIFSTLLGKNSAINQSLFANNSSLYLGVTVGNDTELLPRQQLATVAFAANAETLQGLLPITKPNAGTANVVLALDSSGNLNMGGSANPTFQATGGQFTLSGKVLLLTTAPGSNSNVKIVPDGKGIIDMQKPIQNTSNSNNIASARGAVEVDDLFAILATSSGQSALTINQNSTGPLISASAGGVAKFTVNNAGAGTFASNLAVNGNSLTTTSNTFNLVNTTATTVNIGGAATALSLGASTGTTSVKNNLAVNGTTTFGGQTYSWPSSQSNNAVLQTNGSGQLSWVSLTGLSSWGSNAGALYPATTNNDLLIGGNSTSSAQARISGTNGDIVANGWITTGGNLNVNGGTINSSTDLTLNPSGSNVLFSNGTTLNVGGASAASFNFFANSTSGNNTAADDNDLYIEDVLEVDGPVRFDNSSITLGNSAFANCSSLETVSGILTCGSDEGGSGTNYWQVNNGALSPFTNSTDVLIGSTATASAKFGLINVDSGTPTLNISANNGTNATTLTGDGILGTTNGQALSVGNASTGNVSLIPGGTTALTATSTGVGIEGLLSDISDATLNVDDNLNLTSGNEYQINGTSVLSATTLGSGVVNSSLTGVSALSNGSITAGFGSITTANTITGTTLNATNGINTGAGAGTQRIDDSGNLFNIGTITASGTITANGGATIANGQNLTLGSFTSNNNSVLYTDGSGNIAAATTATTGQCLMSTGNTPTWSACPGASASNYWQSNNGALSPTDSTSDVLVGGTATGSAKFGILNVGSGTPTASLSAGTAGIYIAANGTMQTTNNQGLIIGGDTTGDITLSPRNGAGTVTSTGTLNVASGKTYQIGGVDVLSSTTLGSGVTNSSLTSVGTLTSGTWNATAIAAQYGGTGINTSASTGVPTIAGGTWSVSPTLSAALGGTGVNGSTASNGQLLIGNGSGFSLGNLTAGAGISITNGSGSITISQTGGGSSKWTETNGALTPNNSTLDMLLGGTATSSAKFGVLNMSSGTPTASLSAGATGGTSLTANGILQTTNNQGLLIGGNTTGDITLSPRNGAGTVNSTGTLNLASGKTYQINGVDVLSSTTLGAGVTNSSLTSVGTLTSGTWNATAIGSQYGGTGINTSAATGVPTISGGTWSVASTLSPALGGTGVNGSTASNGQLLIGNGSGYSLATITAGAGISVTNGAGSITIAQTGTASSNSKWTEGNGVLRPNNSTEDVLIGGTATASAKFGVLNMNSGTPTASLSAGTSALYIAANGTMQTTANQGLVLGGSTTGDITLSPRNGAGTVTSTGTMNVASGKTYQIAGTDVLSATTLGAGVTNSSLTSVGALASGSITNGFGTIATANTITGTTLNGTTGINSGAGAGTQRIDATGNLVNIGTVTASGLISANAGLTVANGQNTTLSSFTTNNNSVLYTGASGVVNAATTVTSGQCLMSNANTPAWATCPGSSATNYWQLNSGAVSPFSNTLDVLVGSTATSSAKFGVLNVNSGTPTASLSAGAAGGTYIAANGTLQTTNNQALNIGGTTTGDITLSPRNGSGTVNSTGNLNLSSTKTYKINGTDVLSSTALGTSVIGSSLTSVGTLTTGTWNATAIGTQYGGTGQNWSAVAQGAIPYFSATGTMNTLAAGSAGQCLITNGAGANPSWGTCGAASNLFNSANGAIYAGNSTMDFLLGGTSTTSANFAVLNMNSGTPTASVSGTSNNATSLTSTGVLGTTNKQTLTLGSTSTGNVSLAPGGTAALTALANGNVGIGTTNPDTKLTVIKDSSGLGTGTIGNYGFNVGQATGGLALGDFDTYKVIQSFGNTPLIINPAASNVGIGNVTNPSEKLDVIGNMQVKDAATATKNVRLRTSGLSTDVEAAGATMVISTWSGASFTGTQYSQFVFDNNGADIFASRGLDVTGNIQLNLAGSSNNFALCHENNGASNDQVIKDCSGSPTSDYAEIYATSQDVSYGDVVTIGSRTVKAKALDDKGNLTTDGATVDDRELVKSTTPYDPQVIGIVSNNYGDFSSTGHGRHDDADHPMPVALNGRVPVKMASDSAAIKAGDYITTSSQAGRAMKASKAGQVIGKALEDWNPNAGKATVLVFVNNFWYNPSIQMTAEGNITIAEDVETIKKKLAALEDKKEGAAASSSAQPTSVASPSAITPEELQTVKATVSALKTTVDTHEVSMKDLQNQIDSLKNIFVAQATESAFMKDLNTAPAPLTASSAADLNLETLDVKQATVTEDLSVLGKTTVNDLGITGTMTAGVLAINGLGEDGTASINTMAGDLKIQSTGIGGVDMVAGKFKLDNKGNLNVEGNATFAKDVTVKGKLAAESGKFSDIAANALKIVRGAQADTSATETVAKGSAGSTVIKANQTQRTITSPHVEKDSLIYITATSNTQGVMPYVARQTPEESGTKGSFTIEIPNSVKKDITINWWIVN